MSNFLNKVKDFFLQLKRKVNDEIRKVTNPEAKIHAAPVETTSIIEDVPMLLVPQPSPENVPEEGSPPAVASEDSQTESQRDSPVDSALASPI